MVLQTCHENSVLDTNACRMGNSESKDSIRPRIVNESLTISDSSFNKHCVSLI